MIFKVTDVTGAISADPMVRVYDATGKLKGFGGAGTGTVTSVGLSMPSGFTVTNSPVTGAGILTVTGNGTALDYIDGTGAIQTFPTINTYTADNGLTENPANNFQLGGTLLQNTTITGANFNFSYTGLNRFEVETDDFINLTSTVGSNTSAIDISTGSATPYIDINVKDGIVNHGIVVDNTQIILRTPDVDAGTAVVGQVLTLLNAVSGEAEFQTPTGGTYTVDNGLTESPANNFQLGGTLIQDTTIDGVGNAWKLDFTDLYSSTNTARYLYSFATSHGANNTLLSLDSLSNVSRFSHEDSGTTLISAIELTGTELRVQTPDYATATNGDVLTLLDNTTGEAEWQSIPGTALGFQDVLINDSTLTQNNTVLGGNFNFTWSTFNRYTIETDEFTEINSTSGSNIAAATVNSLGVAPYIDLNVKNSTDIVGIYLDTNEIDLYTPAIDNATATVGDVFTLVNAGSGKGEWQTPTGGGGGLKSGTAIQGPPGVYTTTITGVTAYTAGDSYMIKFDSVNDGASTLDINGLGAIDIFKNTIVPLSEGDIKANQEIMVVYDGTNFQAIGLVANQLLAYVHNAEGSTINKGQVVYAYQASGNIMSVKLAKADADATSAKTIGLVYDSSIANGAEGYIIIQGVIEGINTAAFSAGDTLYLSGTTFGEATNVKQYAPIHLVYVGIVERANAGNGQIYVRCQNGYELDELHDVQAQTPADKDTLWYDNSVTPKQWKTASIPTILGYTPANAAADLTEISISTANAREDNYTPTGWPGTTDRVKVIRIDSTNTNYMMSLGGLSNPTAGRIVTLYNASTANNLIIIENLSTSSTAANRFRMTGNLAYFLLPNRSVTFIYDGTYWTQMSASNTAGLDLFDDMTAGGSAVATTGSTGLHGILGSGTGAGVRPDTVSNDGFGEVLLSTGTTTTGYASISSQIRRNGANSAFAAYAATSSIPYVVVGRIFVSTLATVAQDYRVTFGINGSSSLPTNLIGIGYLWAYSGNAATNWDVVSTNGGGTTSTTTTSVAITANTWYWLGVYKPGGSTTKDAVYFYSSNGVTYSAVSKFVGTTGAYGGSPTLMMGAIAGTTAKALYCDWIGSSFNWTR